MGLFSFVGKALKGISKVAGFIPGIGGTVSKITGTVGNLLDHKAPMSTTTAKLSAISRYGGGAGAQGVVYMRGNAPQGAAGALNQPQVLRASPVLPGGAVATASGPMGKASSPPRTYGGKRTSSKRRKSTTRTKRKGGTTKRRKGTRKLKFGSAAYRKKYLKHRR